MRLPYRADIEGLRAVAILLVVCAHAGLPWLAGGFVGVDVFFVLSGYLITGLLMREFDADGRIAFASFYARRLQRLLPALLLVLITTSGAAMLLLAPFEQLPQAAAAGTAATWTSNLYFALSKLDYFGPASETNLFLHTWSLGVEEQFYLLWPAWLVFLLGAWRWQGGGSNHRRVMAGLVATVVACVLLSVLLTYAAPQLGFYLVFSRGWQFASGGIAFLFLGNSRLPGVLKPVTGWLGLAAIVIAAVLVDGSTPYPGFWALLPSIGAVMILVAGTADVRGGTANGALAARPMQAIGRISYAWYLWHWPVLLLGWTLMKTSSPWSNAMLVGASLALAAISHALVEAPIRRSTWLRQRPMLVLAASAALMMWALAAAHGWSQLAGRWTQTPSQQRYAEVRADLPSIYALGCDEWYHTARVRVCAFGPADAAHTVVLMGDSIAGQWFPAVARGFDKRGWRLLVLTKSSCPMVDHPIFYPRIGREYTECEIWRNAAIRFLDSIRPDLILFSSVPTYDYTLQEWESGTARILDALVPLAGHVGILAPSPLLPFDGPACLARQQWREKFIGFGSDCSAPLGNAGPVNGAIAKAVATHPGTGLLVLRDAICPNQTCRAQRGDQVVYRDNQHLTASFVATLSGALGQELGRAGLLDPSKPTQK